MEFDKLLDLDTGGIADHLNHVWPRTIQCDVHIPGQRIDLRAEVCIPLIGIRRVVGRPDLDRAQITTRVRIGYSVL